jgi:type III secretory pathway component EscS
MTMMTLGDGMIDGAKLKPYRFTWQQCSNQGGVWQAQGEIVEELVTIGELVLRHRQFGNQPGGPVVRSDTYFDRRSFAPLRMEVEARFNGSVVASSERQLDADGYTGVSVQGNTPTELQGSINSQMLHGSVMGLPLATMDYQEEPVEFLASMIAFDGTYVVVAEWAGKEMLEFEGRKIETWLIDVEWLHRESGDVYPPGPDASGGRYWVAPDPPANFPYVPRYQTDTYAVEFVAGVCPPAAH